MLLDCFGFAPSPRWPSCPGPPQPTPQALRRLLLRCVEELSRRIPSSCLCPDLGLGEAARPVSWPGFLVTAGLREVTGVSKAWGVGAPAGSGAAGRCSRRAGATWPRGPGHLSPAAAAELLGLLGAPALWTWGRPAWLGLHSSVAFPTRPWCSVLLPSCRGQTSLEPLHPVGSAVNHALS